jgi:pimeloyl-ACP methyl ester carboxylesterase
MVDSTLAATHFPASSESLQIRVSGDPQLPTLTYLPGVHGDWTLAGSFRARMAGIVRWVEFTYPRTLDWSLDTYAQAIEQALRARGITQTWLLGESFGSQVAWQLLARARTTANATAAPMQYDGLILAGGFARHPTRPLARLSRALWDITPLPCLFRFLRLYLKFAAFRHRHAPETLAGMQEFARRRNTLDRQAMSHRLGLVAANDPNAIAESTSLPVYYLSGWFDPIVPWPFVRAYLRRRCPGYRGHKIIWPADHNILGTAPQAAAQQVQQWMRETASQKTH